MALGWHSPVQKPVLAALLAASLGGCTLAAQQRIETAYKREDHTAFIASGKARIEGQGFIRRANGHLVRCAGGTVYLLPVTPYFSEWVEAFRRGKAVADARQLERDHAEAVRKIQCDIEGDFAFDALPAGKWYLATRIVWQTSKGMMGGALVREVETKPEGTLKTLLADQNRIF